MSAVPSKKYFTDNKWIVKIFSCDPVLIGKYYLHYHHHNKEYVKLSAVSRIV